MTGLVQVTNALNLDLIQRTLLNDLAAWNPVPSFVLLNSPSEVKS